MKKFYTAFVVALCISTASYTQAIQASGIVKDASTGETIPYVTVRVKNAPGGTSTDQEGRFTIRVDSSVQLVFSYIGYESQELQAAAQMAVELKYADHQLDEVIVSVGNRSMSRTLTDTPLPIDVLSGKDLQSTAQPSFDKALQYKVPSFNAVQIPVYDANSMLDPYEIRNLGPSRTLILINGKRKNTSSLVYVQSVLGRGETGADISAIPLQAIKRVEILRDGASAQYGSDAIAGVMNILLKDASEAGTVSVFTGITHQGDGLQLGVDLSNGIQGRGEGFIRYAVSLQYQDEANRAGIVDAQADAREFNAELSQVQAFLAKRPDAGNISGPPRTLAARFLLNAEQPLTEQTTLYGNAAYVYKQVNSYANYRTPYWRPTDFGLLTPVGQPYEGYLPALDGDLIDYHGTLGLTTTQNGWKNDVSMTVGGNRQLYTLRNSINRSLGKNSPTYFRAGGYFFSHLVGNADVSRTFYEKLHVALGTEFRIENFAIIAGDTASHVGTGGDSFSGLSQQNVVRPSRYNIGAYTDVSYDLTPRLLLGGAMRLEKYSDFGNAFVWKLSGRYKLAQEKVIVRASVSTGFRAPTLHQIFINANKYIFDPGQAVQVASLISNISATAHQLGIPALKPEQSAHLTLGVGLEPARNVNITLDYYQVSIKDRIILSAEIRKGNTPQSAALDKLLTDYNLASVSFFANGVQTHTSGLDMVVSYKYLPVYKGSLSVNLASNYTFKSALTGSVQNPALIADAGQMILDQTQEALMLTSRPAYKVIVGLDYTLGSLTLNQNNTLLGPATFRNLGLDPHLKVVFQPKLISDLTVSYELASKVTFSVSVNNLLNVLPQWQLQAADEAGKQLLQDSEALQLNKNRITFNNRYPITTYDASHFNQLGTVFMAKVSVEL